MSDAATAARTDLHVVFEVGDAEYVVRADEVIQMESWQGATAVPGGRPWLAGVVQLRGRVVPIVDLRARFGLPAREAHLDDRIVVVRASSGVVGLKVDRAREVIRIDPDAFEPPPDTLRGDGFVDAVALRDGRLFVHIDLERVVDPGSTDG